MAVLAPIDRPSVTSTTSVKAGLFRSWRRAKRASFQSGIEHCGCKRGARVYGPKSTLFPKLALLAAGAVSGCGTGLVEVDTQRSGGPWIIFENFWASGDYLSVRFSTVLP